MNTQKTLRSLLIASLMLAVIPQTVTAATDMEITASTDPFPVKSGEDARLRLEIQNKGDRVIEAANLTFDESFPISLESGEPLKRELGDLRPGGVYQVATDIVISDDANNDQERLAVAIETRRGGLTDRIPIEMETGEVDLQLGNIVTTPQTLRTGTDGNEVTVDIVNLGDRAAENVILDLSFPFGFEQTSSLATRNSLGTVDPGQTKTATITVDLNESLSDGAATVDGVLSYTNDDSTDRTTRPVSFNLFLDGAPRFAITNITADLQAGESSQIRATVTNTGDLQASSTRLRILDNADMPFSFDSASQYVGTLEPGQSGTAVFETDVENDASVKQHLIDLEARGAQETTIYVDEATAAIDVAKNPDAGENELPITIIGALIAGMIILLGGYLIGKTRNNQESETEDANEQVE